jgi:hypothetical protein
VADIAYYEPNSASGRSQLSIFSVSGSGFNRIWSEYGWGGATWAGVGDFNGDGRDDIAWYEPSSSSGQPQVSIFTSTGSSFTRAWYEQGWASPVWAGIGDFNGDGRSDLAWYENTSSSGQSQMSIFASLNPGFNRIISEYGWAPPTWAGAGDFDGDGKDDIAYFESTSASGSSQMSLFSSVGTGFNRIATEYNWAPPVWAGVGDFNGDSKSDLAYYEMTSASGMPQLSIFSPSGAGFSRAFSEFGWAPPLWASSRGGTFRGSNGSGV